MKNTEEIKQKEWTYENYEEAYFDWKYKAIVKIQEYADGPDPRKDWDNIGKLVIREHRSYTFPNELNFRWDYYDDDYEDSCGDKVENQFEKIAKDYYICWIDMYEHSWIVFSKHWMGMQCPFDTSRWIGFRAVPKVYNWYDLKEIHETKYTEADWSKYMPVEVSLEEAEKIVDQELKDWNQWCSWEIYEYSVYKNTKWTSEDWDVKYTWDWVDGCSWYYDRDHCKDEAESSISYLIKEENGKA